MITRTFGTHTVCFFQTPAGVIAVRGRACENGRFVDGCCAEVFSTLEAAIAYEKALWEEEAAS